MDSGEDGNVYGEGGGMRRGRSKDTHPNQEVLNWIAAMKIGLVSTNDIRKGNVLVWDRDRQNMCDANIEVVDV